MSGTAAARSRVPAQQVPISRPGAANPSRPLRLLPGGGRAPRAPFLAFLASVLTVGMLVLLLLNTALTQGSFLLARWQNTDASLGDSVQALQQQLRAVSNPASLAARAAAMGMVPDTAPAFVRVPGDIVEGDSPLAGQRVRLSAILPGGLAVGPAGPGGVSSGPAATPPAAAAGVANPTAVTAASPSPAAGAGTSSAAAATARPSPAASPSGTSGTTSRSSAAPSPHPSATPNAGSTP